MPVTNRQFAAFVDATELPPTDAERALPRPLPEAASLPPARSKHPVVFVSWFDARAYARGRASASRARPSGRRRRAAPTAAIPVGPRGAAADARELRSEPDGTTPVGAFPEGASPYGVHDLAGQRLGVVRGRLDEDFYANGPSMNPKLASRREEQDGHVMRGGSFMYDARALRTYARMSFDPHYRFAGGGFRCAKIPG